MDINWKLRFQNKVTLIALVVQIVALIYDTLDIFGIVPAIGENQMLYGDRTVHPAGHRCGLHHHRH